MGLQWRVVLAMSLCCGAIVGCSASKKQEPAGPGGNVNGQLCEDTDPGPAPLRRLSPVEFDNTMRDLLEDPTKPASRFVLSVGKTDSLRTADELLAEEYFSAVEEVATRSSSDLAALTGCKPADASDPDCIRGFVERFLPRAFRRPVEDAEVDRYVNAYTDRREDFGDGPAANLVLQSILMSPHFMYRVELTPGADKGAVEELTPHEVATRLSYFLWQTMPDDELRSAADSGELSDPEVLEAQARRLLEDDRAEDTIVAFHTAWLRLNGLAEVVKDPEIFPEYSPAVASLFRTEAEEFVLDVFRNEGTFDALMTSPHTFLNGELAEFYGIDGVKGDDFQRVELDAAEASGVLTQGGFLSVHARGDGTSPIQRGIFMRTSVLCGEVPEPPDDVDTSLPPRKPAETAREQILQHASDPECAACHQLFDGLGFAMEHYDGVGRWRAKDEGKAIDTTGELIGTSNNGSFDGVVDLMDLVMSGDDATECVSRRWFRHAAGRYESDAADECTVERLTTVMHETGGDMRELLVAIAKSRAFRYRRAHATEEP